MPFKKCPVFAPTPLICMCSTNSVSSSDCVTLAEMFIDLLFIACRRFSSQRANLYFKGYCKLQGFGKTLRLLLMYLNLQGTDLRIRLLFSKDNTVLSLLSSISPFLKSKLKLIYNLEKKKKKLAN